MADSNLNRDFSTDSAIEPLFGKVAFDSDASGDIAAGATATFFVDQIGQSAASNMTQSEGDSNLDGGVIPQGQAMELFDLAFNVSLEDDSAYPTEVILAALDRVQQAFGPGAPGTLQIVAPASPLIIASTPFVRRARAPQPPIVFRMLPTCSSI